MQDATSPTPEPERTWLTVLVEKYRLPATLIVGALTLAPNLVAIPFVNRYEVWGGVAVFLLLVVAAHLDAPRTLVRVAGCGAAAAFCIAVVARFPGEDDPRAPARPTPTATATAAATPTPTPQPDIRHVGDDPIATIRAFGHRWVLQKNGDIDRLDADGRATTTSHVDGPAVAIAECAGALMVTHDDGKVARVDPESGDVLADYPYGSESDDVVCGGGYAFVNKPADGTVVQLRPRTLKYVDAFPIVSDATSITFGERAIWVLDGNANELVGVLVDSKQKLGPYRIGDDADQILFVGGYIWILYRASSCLTRFDLAHKVEVGPGVPLGPFASRMRHVDGLILVVDYVDDSILKVDVDTARAARRPIVLGDRGRLRDADQYGDRLLGVDTENGTVVTLSPALQLAHERVHGYPRRDDCRG